MDKTPLSVTPLEDLSVSVTEIPQIGPDGTITWLATYWEIRNGAMGEQITQAIWALDDQGVGAWIDDDPDGGWHDVTVTDLFHRHAYLVGPMIVHLQHRLGCQRLPIR